MKKNNSKYSGSYEKLEQAAKDIEGQKYVLRLYVTGATSKSIRAIENIRYICETELKGRYDLQVIDVYQKPSLAKDEQIIALPTLIKKLPLPIRKFVGDLSDMERVLFGLDLRPRK